MTDKEFEEQVIEEVREDDEHWTITVGDGMSFWFAKNRNAAVRPKVGDMARFYGLGFGYPVRGLSINGVIIFYETADEAGARRVIEQVEHDRAQKAEADARRPAMDARVAALPDCFQKRIARFRRNNPDFYWQHEDYEMASCVDAVKIADAMRADPEPLVALDTFRKLPWEEQRKVVPDLDTGHSGNTFGMAVRLAHHYLTDERYVFADHAAISPLTGCECGCPPVTDDEMVAAGYVPFSELPA